MECAICGATFTHGERYTKDHVFPIAIYKWSGVWCPDETEHAKLIQSLSSDANIQFVHEKCNFAKADEIPELQTLTLDTEDFEALTGLRKDIEDHVDAFVNLKDRLLMKQKYKCYCCGDGIVNGVIRRINPKHERNVKNACIVCNTCGAEVESFTHVNSIGFKLKRLLCK